METKLNKQQIETIKLRCGFTNGFDVSVDGSKGGLCLAWKEGLQVDQRNFRSSFIDVEIVDTEMNGR